MKMQKKPKIVFLDTATVDRQDLDLGDFLSLGQVTCYPRTTPSQIISRCKKATLVVTNKCVLGEKELAALPDLRLIAVTATGYNNIDTFAAKKKKIAVANVAGYSTVTVAEHTILFLLALSHRLLKHDGAAKRAWSSSLTYAILDYPYLELAGKTLGVIGYGNIGRKVKKLAEALGMKVLVAKLPARTYPKSSKRTSLAEIFRKSDYITLHSALSPYTRHLIDTKALSVFKKTAYLLNLSRGPLVDEKAVARALLKNKLAGYATDVMETEPPPLKHPFWNLKLKDKIILTPHIAWASREARQRLMNEVTKNIQAFLNGKKRNRVV